MKRSIVGQRGRATFCRALIGGRPGCPDRASTLGQLEALRLRVFEDGTANDGLERRGCTDARPLLLRGEVATALGDLLLQLLALLLQLLDGQQALLGAEALERCQQCPRDVLGVGADPKRKHAFGDGVQILGEVGLDANPAELGVTLRAAVGQQHHPQSWGSARPMRGR